MCVVHVGVGAAHRQVPVWLERPQEEVRCPALSLLAPSFLFDVVPGAR